MIVRSVKRASSPARQIARGANASITLPTAVAWGTLGRPTRAMLTTLEGEGTKSTVIASLLAGQRQRGRLAGLRRRARQQRAGELADVELGEHAVGERHSLSPSR